MKRDKIWVIFKTHAWSIQRICVSNKNTAGNNGTKFFLAMKFPLVYKSKCFPSFLIGISFYCI